MFINYLFINLCQLNLNTEDTDRLSRSRRNSKIKNDLGNTAVSTVGAR